MKLQHEILGPYCFWTAFGPHVVQLLHEHFPVYLSICKYFTFLRFWYEDESVCSPFCSAFHLCEMMLILQSVSSQQKANALGASFVYSPVGENLDWRLSATISPCHVTVNFFLILWINIISVINIMFSVLNHAVILIAW